MMAKKELRRQVLSAAFLSVMLLPVSVNRSFFGSGDFLSFAVSALISGGINLILFFAFQKMREKGNGKASMHKAAVLFYALYFALMSSYAVSLIFVLIENVVEPELPLCLLLLAFGAVACFGAVKGRETLLRTSGIVIFLMAVLYVLMIFSAGFQLRKDNFNADGIQFKSVVQGVFAILPRSVWLPVLIFFEKNACGRDKIPILYITAAFLGFAILLFVSNGVMGSYGETQLFPFYSLASVSGIGSFLRLEVLSIAFWFLCSVVHCAVLFCLIKKCFSFSFDKKFASFGFYGTIGVVMIFSFFVIQSTALKRFVFGTPFLLTAFILMLIVSCICCCKKLPLKKNLSVLILPILVVILFSGCTAAPLSEKIVVQGVCVDKEENGYKVALLTVIPEKENRMAASFRGEGESVFEAVKRAQENSGKIPIFSRDMLILFGKECGEDIEPSLEFFMRYYEIRPTANVILVQGEALQLTELHKENRFATEEIESLFSNNEGGIEKVSLMTLGNYLLSEKNEAYLPVIGIEEDMILPEGLALLRDSLKQLNLKEGKLYLAVREKLFKMDCTIETEKGKVSVLLGDFSVKNQESAVEISCKGLITEMEDCLGQAPTESEYLHLEEAFSENLKAEWEKIFPLQDFSVKVSINRTEEELTPLF